MRLAIALVAVLALAACTRQAEPTAKPAVYSGPRTHNFPTPGQIHISNDDRNGIYLEVTGGLAATVRVYGEAWRVDGWVETGREQAGETTIVHMERDTNRQLLIFRPFGDSANTIFVHISPPELWKGAGRA
jgi:hypothetical protein